ncbi:hypothetical protein [Agrobacterium sp.]|uniref:hypothetical protein n=1 Tax=Agrobacterium sp. TaxID=361 RepID=UPI0028A8EE48
MSAFKTLPKTADVEIRRTADLSFLSPLDEDRAGSEDGIALNLAYFDVRDRDIEDAALAQEEELDLLKRLDDAGWTTDAAEEILEEQFSDFSELAGFDPGMGAAVYALSAAGATPISSCNGGTIGQSHHSETVASILFAAGENFQPELIIKAAQDAGLGIIPNREFAEIFADQVLKFITFQSS